MNCCWWFSGTTHLLVDEFRREKNLFRRKLYFYLKLKVFQCIISKFVTKWKVGKTSCFGCKLPLRVQRVTRVIEWLINLQTPLGHWFPFVPIHYSLLYLFRRTLFNKVLYSPDNLRRTPNFLTNSFSHHYFLLQSRKKFFPSCSSFDFTSVRMVSPKLVPHTVSTNLRQG